MFDDVKRELNEISEKTGKHLTILRYDKEWNYYKIFLKKLIED